MPDKPIEPREHYVYALYREDGVTPFYIGMGKGPRWNAHERFSNMDQSPKCKMIRKVQRLVGGPVPKAKLRVDLTAAEAAVIEISLISEIGRAPRGSLLNFTDGGDGTTGLTEDGRQRQKQASRKAWDDPVKKAARVVAMKAAWTPEKRENMRRKQEAMRTPEARAAHSEKLKAYWLARNGRGPKQRPPDNRSAWMKARWAADRKGMLKGLERAREVACSPEVRAHTKRAVRAFWATPGNKGRPRKSKWTPEQKTHMRAIMTEPQMLERLRAASKNGWDVPKDQRAARIERLRVALMRPEVRAKRSASAKKLWAERREEILLKRKIKRQSRTMKADPNQS